MGNKHHANKRKTTTNPTSVVYYFEQWNLLPTELQTIVLSFLPPEDLCQVCLVDHKCEKLANDQQLWKGLCVSCFSKEAIVLESDDVDWKETFVSLSTKILIIYHVFNSSQPLSDLAETLNEVGITSECMAIAWGSAKGDEISSWLDTVRAAIKNHKAALYFSNGGLNHEVRNGLGDILCDFVEEGNCVIMAPFGSVPGEMLGGRWRERDYDPLDTKGQSSSEAIMAEKLVPDHPILRNVKDISCTYRMTGQPKSAAKVIARFSSGEVVAAELETAGGGLALLCNLFPLSTEVSDGAWKRGCSDVPVMLGNVCRHALVHACKHSKAHAV